MGGLSREGYDRAADGVRAADGARALTGVSELKQPGLQPG